jgi:hypothetical protein
MSNYKKLILSKLRNTQTGRAAFVAGGGPALPDDWIRFERGPDWPGALVVAVNYHALEIGIPAEIMVYNDHPTGPQADKMIQAIRTFDGIKISPEPTSDVQFDVEVWTGSFSSHTATWIALYLGCMPVVLGGMDCYQGASLYCHDMDAPPPTGDPIRPWVEDARNLLPDASRVRVMSGPLIGLFPKYEGSQE